jgi:hypothetical protein
MIFFPKQQMLKALDSSEKKNRVGASSPVLTMWLSLTLFSRPGPPLLYLSSSRSKFLPLPGSKNN